VDEKNVTCRVEEDNLQTWVQLGKRRKKTTPEKRRKLSLSGELARKKAADWEKKREKQKRKGKERRRGEVERQSAVFEKFDQGNRGGMPRRPGKRKTNSARTKRKGKNDAEQPFEGEADFDLSHSHREEREAYLDGENVKEAGTRRGKMTSVDENMKERKILQERVA